MGVVFVWNLEEDHVNIICLKGLLFLNYFVALRRA